MKVHKLVLCALGLLILCAGVSAQDIATLKFKFKEVKLPGISNAEAAGINNAGISVGVYFDTSSAVHGYIWNNKTLTKLDDPNGDAGTTNVGNIMPDGATTVVGYYTSSKTGNVVGYIYKGGKFTDVAGPKGAVSTYLSAINDSGDIAGYYVDTAGVDHGFLLKKGKYTTLNAPGAADTIATGVNKSDEVCMYTLTSGGALSTSYVYKGGKYTKIAVPGAAASAALDLNTAGDVVFEWLDSSNNIHGALLHANKYYKADYPKQSDSYTGGVNDKGLIVGGYASSTSGPWTPDQVSY